MTHVYDLFVVHAAGDAEFVHGYLLPALNLPASRVLLVDRLRPGASMIAEIDRGVVQSRFTIAVLSPAYLADRWAVFGEQLASSLSAAEERVIPLRLIDCQLPLHLDARVVLDFTARAGWDDGVARLRALLQTDPPAGESIVCPYPGMRPFTASDAGLFFGRDQELGDLIGRLDRGEREIYVIGPSGSGKSSFVQAGLLHALDTGSSRLGRSFVVRSMRPGERPADRLAKALEGELATPDAAIDALVASQPAAERVLVFIDQLEELFTLAGAAERQRFIATLQALRAVPRCYLLFALRADFYGALMDSALWADLAGRISRIDVAPLLGPALARAITEPALRVGVYIEPRLCDRLVADAADEPGALPLVQETLRLLWERRRQKLLGVAEYEALGDGGGAVARRGLDVAIAQYADTAMRELSVARQAIARRVLLRLVSFGEGRADTRRQQPVEALQGAADDATELSVVLQHLVAHRLVTVDDAERPDEAVADLSHEALITAWPALAAWIAARRADEQRRRRLEVKVGEWIEHGRGETSLLDRVELSEAVQWMQGDGGRELGSGGELSALVAASRRAIEQLRRQRRWRIMLVIATLAAFSVVVSVLGLRAQRRADENNRMLGRSYLDQGQALLRDGHPVRALPYLVAAREHQIEDPMFGMLFAYVANTLPRVTLVGHTAAVTAVAFSPDGTRAVTASRDNTARIWNTATGEEVTPRLVHQRPVLAATFSPNGTRVVTASADATARVWNASTGTPVTPPLAHRLSVYYATFSPDGTRVVTASVDKTAQVWNASTGAAVTPPLVHQELVTRAAFSPDGTRVVTASNDHTARVWDASTGAAVTPPLKHGNLVGDAAFSPDGKYVVTASVDHTAQVWDATTGEAVREFSHGGVVHAAMFSPDGRQVITASADHTARVWDVRSGVESGNPLDHPDSVSKVMFSADGKQILTVSGDGVARVWDRSNKLATAIEHARPITAAAFSPDGRRVITASNDHTARIWDASPDPSVPTFKLPGAVYNAAFSPDSTRVVTAGPGDTAQVFSALTGAPVTPPLVHDHTVYTAAFSPDGVRVVTASEDKTARVWNAWTGLLVASLRHPDSVNSAAFSPDGSRVITVGHDRIVRLWDAITGAPVAKPLVHAGQVRMAAFSPDGTQVISASGDEAWIWDAATAAMLTSFHHPKVRVAAFSPDGRRVVTAGWDSTARVWDARTGPPLAAPFEHEGDVHAAAFSPDGTRVVTASADRRARIWNVATGALVTPPLEHTKPVLVAMFSPDGTYVITGSSDHAARIWDVVTGKPVSPPLEHSASVSGVAFSPDGRRVATSSIAGTQIWNIVIDMVPLDRWRFVARCSPFTLDGGVLQANLAPDPPKFCPRQ